jgi:hypothetical protein
MKRHEGSVCDKNRDDETACRKSVCVCGMIETRRLRKVGQRVNVCVCVCGERDM